MQLRDEIRAFQPYNEQERTEKALILRYMELFPELLSRENDMAHFTASCWIVNPARDRVLMAYHNIYRSWAWLGGHADGEAELLRVALREAQEESGIAGARALTEQIFSLEILGVPGHVKRGRWVGAHLHLNATFLLEADDRLPLRAKVDENSDVRWIPTGQVEQAVSEPEMRVVYRKLMEKAKKF